LQVLGLHVSQGGIQVLLISQEGAQLFLQDFLQLGGLEDTGETIAVLRGQLSFALDKVFFL